MSLPTPASIARLEEAQLARAFVALAPQTLALAGGIAARGTPGSWINKAIGLGMDAPIAPEAVDALIDFYASAGIEPRIEVSPYADPSLIAALSERGFVIRRFAQTLVRALDATRPPDTGSPPDDLRLEIVDPNDGHHVAEFARTAARGLAPPGTTPRPIDEEVWAKCCRVPGTTCVLARLNGHPASASGMEVVGPYARLFGLSTLPEFRRRGLQRAGLIKRLSIAADQGATFATITSEPGGPTERNAVRIGFHPVFTRVILVRPTAGLTPVGGAPTPPAPTHASPG